MRKATVMRPKPAGIASRYGTLEARHGFVVKATKATVDRTDRSLTPVRTRSNAILTLNSTEFSLSRSFSHDAWESAVA